MKPAFFFFLCFSFLLLSGSNHICLPVSLQSSYSVSRDLSKNEQQVQPVSQSKSNFITSADADGNGYDDLNALEPEDTDDEDFRFLEWSGHFLQPYYNLLSGSSVCHSKDQLPACLHFAWLASDKYITYRVIRI